MNKIPNIFEEIEKILRTQGFSGSTDIPKIVFLAATTRLFQKPVSLAVFGPSGVGKSYAVEAGLQFIPPKEIEALSGMSEKALPYLGSETSLKHRILFLGEAAGMADGNGRAFLRQLLSEGKIDYMTVQKTSKGLVNEKLPTVEGPVCFMMTTTASRIHHEDQSRMLILNMDYNPEAIRESLLNTAAGKTKSEVDVDFQVWHNLQEKLSSESKEVEIPYAGRLAEHLPVDNIKVQRDFPKILAMIRACALVHKEFRYGNNYDGIVASREDYEHIYDLLRTPLSQGLEANVTSGVKAVVDGVRSICGDDRQSSFEGVSQSKLSEYLSFDRSSVLRNVHSAIERGYLVNLNPGKGREAKLILGERKLVSEEALPHPDVLFDGLPSEQVHRCTGTIVDESDPIPQVDDSIAPWDYPEGLASTAEPQEADAAKQWGKAESTKLLW